jgi:hypothetical protein
MEVSAELDRNSVVSSEQRSVLQNSLSVRCKKMSPDPECCAGVARSSQYGVES